MKSFRRLSTRDYGAVLEINAESLPGVARIDEPELTRLIALPNAHLAITHEDEVLLGYALAFPDHAPYDGEEFHVLLATCPRPFLYIDQVAVKTGMRRKGVAAALYSALEAEARGLLMSGLCCEVNLDPPNPTSVAFHKAMGFERLGELSTTDGRTVMLMRKNVE